MTKEFPNDPMPNAAAWLFIRAWSFFSHYGFVIGYSAQRHGLVH
jgi:hypothetical protein